MASIFSKTLRQCSYKGVPFQAAAVTKTIQRRQVLHEYPQRDIPYLEDLGKGATLYKVTAFLVGDNCVAQAKRLEKALLTVGAGTFVHPWDGALTVSVYQASNISYSNSELRYCSLDITFVEAGELGYPNKLADGPTLARQLADKLGLSAVSDFVESFKQTAAYKLVQAAINGTLLETLGIISDAEIAQILGFVDEVTTFAEQAIGLLTDEPRGFAEKLSSVLGLARFASIETRWSGIVNQISQLTTSEELNRCTNQFAQIPAVVSNIETESLQDSAAVETLTRQILLANAIGASTLIGTSLDTADTVKSDQSGSWDTPDGSGEDSERSDPDTVTTSVDELLEVRDHLIAAIDNELQNPLISDDLFINLLQARSVVFSILTSKAEGLSRLLSIETPQIEPSLVLAYDYYDDASRSDEIETRNRVIHGAFCPSELRILSK
ncbi:DNA circularization N-terminal domain-containing protein [uncultured Parasutterella sp.]|uniref:DNA circularization protein n=1 Tax=uncultured Parasutterella sp. TaxID=1263098 RepID=UPI002598CD30|nr:DNA circularization N-terminal domain-containing protein [uncultured Parasutterella sp.]